MVDKRVSDEKGNQAAMFQARVDELLVLEQRIARQAEAFIATVREEQQHSQQSVNNLLTTIKDTMTRQGALWDTVNSVKATAQDSVDTSHRARQLLWASLVVCVITLWGSFLWWFFVNHEVIAARIALTGLQSQIQQTPTMVTYKGRGYVRMVPGSEAQMYDRRGYPLPGQYAKMWITKKN